MRPETQINSYHELENKEQKQMRVLQAIKKNKGATLFELCKILNWPVNRISGRVTELSKMGFILDSGIRKINPDSKKSGIVWMAAK